MIGAQTPGWSAPYSSPKQHYFKDGVSLCRRYVYRGVTTEVPAETPGVCKPCKRKHRV